MSLSYEEVSSLYLDCLFHPSSLLPIFVFFFLRTWWFLFSGHTNAWNSFDDSLILYRGSRRNTLYFPSDGLWLNAVRWIAGGCEAWCREFVICDTVDFALLACTSLRHSNSIYMTTLCRFVGPVPAASSCLVSGCFKSFLRAGERV